MTSSPAPREDAPTHGHNVLLPVFEPAHSAPLLYFGETLARRRGGHLILTQVVTVPEERRLSEGLGEAAEKRQQLDAMLAEHDCQPAVVRSLVRVSHEAWDGLWQAVEEEGADLLLLAWDHQKEPRLEDVIDRRLQSPPVNVVIVRPALGVDRRESWLAIDRILLPLRSGPDAELAVNAASFLARLAGAEITHLNVLEETEDEEARAGVERVRSLGAVTRSITAAGNIVDTIVEGATEHDAVVLGAPTRSLRGDRFTSTVIDTLVGDYDCTMLVVKRRSAQAAEEEVWHKPRLPQVVDRWFAENTFHSEELEGLERLVELKQRQGLTISLGLPALNEEETVGNVIRATKGALMDDVPLLDEVVLIDSDSQDRTREIARDLGVPVHVHQQILPEKGAYRGKGEALWKSLHVLEGDLIAWIDTDIKNIHPRFVCGVLGPLLKEPRLQYVKGFYQRPLKSGDKMVAGGGGRVTELTARPMLNLFFPQLSGFIQPLAGEYAGRREALESVPFFTGYGVETGLLIDLLRRYGLEALGQSDLLERIHHNQPLASLSRMSFAIIQVVVSRLERLHGKRLLGDLDKTMNQILQRDDGYRLETAEIVEHERPPMIDLPEYRARRQLLAEQRRRPEPTPEASER